MNTRKSRTQSMHRLEAKGDHLPSGNISLNLE